MDVGDAGREHPMPPETADGERTLHIAFLCGLLLTQVVWIGGLVALGLWLT